MDFLLFYLSMMFLTHIVSIALKNKGIIHPEKSVEYFETIAWPYYALQLFLFPFIFIISYVFVWIENVFTLIGNRRFNKAKAEIDKENARLKNLRRAQNIKRDKKAHEEAVERKRKEALRIEQKHKRKARLKQRRNDRVKANQQNN